MPAAHSTCACVPPCSQTSRARSCFARNVPSQVVRCRRREQQSVNIRTVRARTITTAARIVVRSSVAYVPSKIAHCLSSRPTPLVLLTCVAERAAAEHISSARRRADELLAGGASRTSSRTTTEPAERSEPGHRASSSACRRGSDGTYVCVWCMWSMWELRECAPQGLVRLCWRLELCRGRVRCQDRPCCVLGAAGDPLGRSLNTCD